MKRLFAAFAITLMLGGCAGTRLGDVLSIATASITNPVTKERLNQIEATVQIVFVGLNTWKRSCVAGLLNENCKQQILTVQIYTRQIPPYLKDLRRFVKDNDQVNAIVVYNQLTDIISRVRSEAAAGGQNLGA